ncbi:hypothetical protein ACVMIH_005480 [Bradyrhizobium sp. USDA 4503]
MDTAACYLEPTWNAGRDFAQREIAGELVMLNLLRFRVIADYSQSPELAPPQPITGAEAYLAGIGHRTAALADSRLLPLVELPR